MTNQSLFRSENMFGGPKSPLIFELIVTFVMKNHHSLMKYHFIVSLTDYIELHFIIMYWTIATGCHQYYITLQKPSSVLNSRHALFFWLDLTDNITLNYVTVRYIDIEKKWLIIGKYRGRKTSGHLQTTWAVCVEFLGLYVEFRTRIELLEKG